MRAKVRFLGLDVHAETNAVAVAKPDGEVRSLGTIANRGGWRTLVFYLHSPTPEGGGWAGGPPNNLKSPHRHNKELCPVHRVLCDERAVRG